MTAAAKAAGAAARAARHGSVVMFKAFTIRFTMDF